MFLGREATLRAKKVIKFLSYSETPALELVKLHAGIRYVTSVNQNFHKLPPEVESDFLFGKTQRLKLAHHREMLRVVCC